VAESPVLSLSGIKEEIANISESYMCGTTIAISEELYGTLIC